MKSMLLILIGLFFAIDLTRAAKTAEMLEMKLQPVKIIKKKTVYEPGKPLSIDSVARMSVKWKFN